MQTGTIKWFNSTKGYGFIEPSDKSRGVFVHISALQHLDIRELNPSTRVSFETEENEEDNLKPSLKLKFFSCEYCNNCFARKEFWLRHRKSSELLFLNTNFVSNK